ncbi:hypothetical protein [Moraxella lacunata]
MIFNDYFWVIGQIAIFPSQINRTKLEQGNFLYGKVHATTF